MNGDRNRVIEYVKSLRRRGVSSKVTLYAIENLKGEERKAVLETKPKKKGILRKDSQTSVRDKRLT